MAAEQEAVSHLEAVVERQARFVGSYAHEIRTALTTIIGYADLLRLQKLDEGERAEAAEFILAEGQRLERLSQLILDLVVLEGRPLRLHSASPGTLVRGLVERLAPLYAADGVDLSCACEGGACLMEPDLVASLVENLCENARKALGGPGEVRVTCQALADGCRISVSDTGPGIPPEALDRLAEPFYRVEGARPSEGGAGLGLTLCHGIATAHKGSLSFASEPGEGTTVIAELHGGAA